MNQLEGAKIVCTVAAAPVKEKERMRRRGGGN
jgi:hypothetical protein